MFSLLGDTALERLHRTAAMIEQRVPGVRRALKTVLFLQANQRLISSFVPTTQIQYLKVKMQTWGRNYIKSTADLKPEKQVISELTSILDFKNFLDIGPLSLSGIGSLVYGGKYVDSRGCRVIGY